jgi:hypothetical protein
MRNTGDNLTNITKMHARARADMAMSMAKGNLSRKMNILAKQVEKN